MKLEEFKVSIDNINNDFKSYWEEGVKNTPENFPKEMSDNEWMEQYLVYLSI